jgi:hypothetical protein
MTMVTVGPVIGKVTALTARVLIECDRDASIDCSATGPTGPPIRQTQNLKRGRPKVFEFTSLRPDTEYLITIDGADCPVPSQIRTYPELPTALNVGAVSCNFTVQRQDTDLWRQLGDHYVRPRLLDLLLHIGDQVYGDETFQQALYLLNGRSRGTAVQERKILELYRQLYRWTWGFPSTRAVLAAVPNLMIWDDHEIRDDWGSNPADRDPNSPEQYVGGLARRVYREYQRQLWDSIDVDVDPPGGAVEDHWHVWGSIGVLFLDQRGARSFAYDPQRPYLGSAQWQRVTAALAPGGALAGVRALMVVTSVPLAYLGDGISTIGSELMNDLMDHWAYGPHQKEQVECLRALRRWKQAGDGERELLVLGGDVHIGCRTEVQHSGQMIFKQLITSPMTNKPPSWTAFQGLVGLLERDQNLGDNYSFKHSNYTRQRNFGIVIARVPDHGTPKIDPTLVVAV